MHVAWTLYFLIALVVSTLSVVESCFEGASDFSTAGKIVRWFFAILFVFAIAGIFWPVLLITRIRTAIRWSKMLRQELKGER